MGQTLSGYPEAHTLEAVSWQEPRTGADGQPAQDAEHDARPALVTFASRMHNGEEKPSEIYYSNGGELNLITNKVSPAGGLIKRFAEDMKMQPNLLPEMDLGAAEKVVASANTGGDTLTSNHVRNWMECIRSRQQPNGPVEAGYNHSIATIMTNAAVRTGAKVTFDVQRQEVMANGKPFKY